MASEESIELVEGVTSGHKWLSVLDNAFVRGEKWRETHGTRLWRCWNCTVAKNPLHMFT